MKTIARGPAESPRRPLTIGEIPWWQFALRVFWVTVQLLLVFCLGQGGSLFFYQGF